MFEEVVNVEKTTEMKKNAFCYFLLYFETQEANDGFQEHAKLL